MSLPDCAITPIRKQAIENRGKAVQYKEFVSETTNYKTGTTTPVFRTKELKALVSGVSRSDQGTVRTFRFAVASLPEYPPSEKSRLEIGNVEYRVVSWKTSQHEDVVDITGAAP